MNQQWLSVIEAADVLGVKPAVVRRQIIMGEIESRFGEHGRQVLVGDRPAEGGQGGATGPVPLWRLALWSWVLAATLAVFAGAIWAQQGVEPVESDRGEGAGPVQAEPVLTSRARP